MIKTYNNQRIAYGEELAALQNEAQNATGGKVHILKEVFPGTRISIGTAGYKVENVIPFATFKFYKDEIVFVACEYTKR